jgi:hypothetical protein
MRLSSLLQTFSEDFRMKLIRESYSPESFGDAEAIFECDSLRIRFERERLQNFAYIAVEGSDEWWNIVPVCMAVAPELVTFNPFEDWKPAISEVCELLRVLLPRVRAELRVRRDETVARIREQGKIRDERFIARIWRTE